MEIMEEVEERIESKSYEVNKLQRDLNFYRGILREIREEITGAIVIIHKIFL